MAAITAIITMNITTTCITIRTTTRAVFRRPRHRNAAGLRVRGQRSLFPAQSAAGSIRLMSCSASSAVRLWPETAAISIASGAAPSSRRTQNSAVNAGRHKPKP